MPRVCVHFRVYLQVLLASSRGYSSPTFHCDLSEAPPPPRVEAKHKTQVRSVCPPHWWSCCPAVPGPLQTGPLAGPGRRTLDNKQRVTSPLHLGEDSNPSSVEDVRFEGDGLCWISRATRRSSPL
ncbi:hypothetical protein DPMN_011688 [Dreissena polymorpha]|uniref:Uncharacterized protein n=1 Tax=Dreissena polymorpha TaxID=45954 RepID=A0A9D4S231_DREPO|nr:hypothetical protein DPMN_011688 [Dreissena polymorpha]